ncbi:MAG: ABC transporter ATP-binding protein [Bacillota bacterium]
MEEYILSVNNLCKSYNAFSLKNVGFEIPRGYIMGFIGKNGAGKSTTIKCIMDLIPFESGTIKLFNLDNRQHSDEIRQRVGYVSEEQYFYENMSVGWTVNFFGGFYPNWDRNYCKELLERFAIDPSKKVSELSKGMKMKLALTIALSHKPELLILDEPTSGLDPVVRDELLELLLEIVQDENRSVFFSSHITSDIEKIADFITIIENGEIILSDEKDAIIDKWRLFKIDNMYGNEKIFGRLRGLKRGEFGYSGITDNPDGFINEFRRMFPDGKFIMERVSLDELLLRMVKDGGEA